jgi:hypothetical protein
MMDLNKIAARLDNEERLSLKYWVSAALGEQGECQVRTDRLLDVAEDRGIFYVDRNGEPTWVSVDEVIEVVSDSDVTKADY